MTPPIFEKRQQQSPASLRGDDKGGQSAHQKASSTIGVALKLVKHLMVGFKGVVCLLEQPCEVVQAARERCAVSCIVHSLDMLCLGSQDRHADPKLREHVHPRFYID